MIHFGDHHELLSPSYNTKYIYINRLSETLLSTTLLSVTLNSPSSCLVPPFSMYCVSDICPSFLSVGGTRRSTHLGGKRRTNGSNMGEPIEAIEELRKRTTAGAATFLVKVKSHRGEPANEEAHIQATRLFQAKMFPRNGTTGQIRQFSHGKSLAGKEVQ